jgi:hypothetical protein
MSSVRELHAQILVLPDVLAQLVAEYARESDWAFLWRIIGAEDSRFDVFVDALGSWNLQNVIWCRITLESIDSLPRSYSVRDWIPDKNSLLAFHVQESGTDNYQRSVTQCWYWEVDIIKLLALVQGEGFKNRDAHTNQHMMLNAFCRRLRMSLQKAIDG